MSGWQPIETYPFPAGRDAAGKWQPGPDGPIADLKFADGKIVHCAQWRGERNVQGGVTHAFWVSGDTRGIGICDPQYWRPNSSEAA